MQHLCGAVDVVGVHDQRLAHRVGGPGEAREDQHGRVPHLAGHELLGHEVHAVAQRCHEGHRRVAVEAAELLVGNGAVEVADRGPVGGGEAAVDAPDQLVDLAFELAVLDHLCAAGHGHLEQHHLFPVLRVELEQPLEGADALGDALGVVEAVGAQHDLLALHLGLGRRRLGERLEAVELDPDGKAPDPRGAVAVLHHHLAPVDPGPQGALGAVEEVLRVAPHVEADEIAGEQGLEDLARPGEQAEDVVGREGDVEEEGEVGAGAFVSHRDGCEHELIVVQPHEPVLGLREGRLGEAPVDAPVVLPLATVEVGAGRERVHQRPERAVREAVVVALDLGLAQGNGVDPVGEPVRGDRLSLAQVDAGPADPRAAALTQHRIERGDEPARGRAPLQPFRGAREGERQAVAGHHDGPLAGRARRCLRHVRQVTTGPRRARTPGRHHRSAAGKQPARLRRAGSLHLDFARLRLAARSRHGSAVPAASAPRGSPPRR